MRRWLRGEFMENLNFFCRREAWFGNELSIYLYNKSQDSMVAVAEPLVFKMVPREEQQNIEPRPLIRLCPESAQRLMDELFSCGIRPSEGSGSAGSLAATQRHLEDMRAIVANSLGVEMPKK